MRSVVKALGLLLRLVVGAAFVAAWALCVLLPWALLSARSDLPAWVPYGVAGLVFPLLPLCWQLVRERRFGPDSLLRGRDRFILRSFVIAGLAAGLTWAIAPAQALAQWSIARRTAVSFVPPNVAAWVARALPTRTQGLDALAPADSHWLTVASLERAAALLGSPSEDLVIEPCGLDLHTARAMLAAKLEEPEPQFLVAMRAPGLATPATLACLGEHIGQNPDFPAKVRIEEGDDSSRRVIFTFESNGAPKEVPTDVIVVDTDTLALVTPGWHAAAVAARDGRENVLDGPLGGALARIDRAEPFWGAGKLEVDGHSIEGSGTFDVDGPLLHWAGSLHADDPARAEQLANDAREAAQRLQQLSSALAWFAADAGQLAIEAKADGPWVDVDIKANRDVALRLAATLISTALVGVL